MLQFSCAGRAAAPENSLYVTWAHAGYNGARHHLFAHRTPARPALYSETIGPFVSWRVVLDAVLGGQAKGASVVSYLLDLQRWHRPNVPGRLRVVPTIEPAPIPPVIPYSRKARLT